MFIRIGCLRPITLASVMALMTLVSYADQSSSPQSPAPAFRLTQRGLELQQRAGVPVSGVVLYEPTGMQGAIHPLLEAGPNVRCNQDALGNRQN